MLKFVVLALLCAKVSAYYTLDHSTSPAQEPAPPVQDLQTVFRKKPPYSPYADRHFPERVYWGDTHLHTSFSMDAGAFGCRLRPRGAYRFAKGRGVTASSGQQARLARPLDFLVVADHSDGFGAAIFAVYGLATRRKQLNLGRLLLHRPRWGTASEVPYERVR